MALMSREVVDCGRRRWPGVMEARPRLFFFFFFVIFFFSCIAPLCSLLRCWFLFVRFTLSFVGWRFCVVKCKVDGRRCKIDDVS
jgi:hypothetical protein